MLGVEITPVRNPQELCAHVRHNWLTKLGALPICDTSQQLGACDQIVGALLRQQLFGLGEETWSPQHALKMTVMDLHKADRTHWVARPVSTPKSSNGWLHGSQCGFQCWELELAVVGPIAHWCPLAHSSGSSSAWINWVSILAMASMIMFGTCEQTGWLCRATCRSHLCLVRAPTTDNLCSFLACVAIQERVSPLQSRLL